VARAHSVTPLIEAGQVFINELAEWLITFLEETKAFPMASHDDIVDSIVYALLYLSGKLEPDLLLGLDIF